MLRKIAKVRRDSHNYVPAAIVKGIGSRIEFLFLFLFLLLQFISVNSSSIKNSLFE
jgi:hypothetical protein